VRWRSPHVRAELAAYRNAIGRFIYITPTDSFFHVTPADSLRVYRYQQANARLVGGEAAVEVEVASLLRLHARADAVRGTNRATGDPLPLVPAARAALGAELHHDRAGRWADRAYAGAEVEVATRQTRLNPSTSQRAVTRCSISLPASCGRCSAGLATSISQSATRPT